ncbi:unnamed protein product [Prorocentrum cordatum]|uniref:Uncharacterized protein n=1 Tax=Prorocentrum cordatum TaxID=2364126 RepID=A0ABN9PUX4_9DINO|nr:unnamed protein product [Polarella glacialis]
MLEEQHQRHLLGLGRAQAHALGNQDLASQLDAIRSKVSAFDSGTVDDLRAEVLRELEFLSQAPAATAPAAGLPGAGAGLVAAPLGDEEGRVGAGTGDDAAGAQGAPGGSAPWGGGAQAAGSNVAAFASQRGHASVPTPGLAAMQACSAAPRSAATVLGGAASGSVELPRGDAADPRSDARLSASLRPAPFLGFSALRQRSLAEPVAGPASQPALLQAFGDPPSLSRLQSAAGPAVAAAPSLAEPAVQAGRGSLQLAVARPGAPGRALAPQHGSVGACPAPLAAWMYAGGASRQGSPPAACRPLAARAANRVSSAQDPARSATAATARRRLVENLSGCAPRGAMKSKEALSEERQARMRVARLERARRSKRQRSRSLSKGPRIASSKVASGPDRRPRDLRLVAACASGHVERRLAFYPARERAVGNPSGLPPIDGLPRCRLAGGNQANGRQKGAGRGRAQFPVVAETPNAKNADEVARVCHLVRPRALRHGVLGEVYQVLRGICSTDSTTPAHGLDPMKERLAEIANHCFHLPGCALVLLGLGCAFAVRVVAQLAQMGRQSLGARHLDCASEHVIISYYMFGDEGPISDKFMSSVLIPSKRVTR